MIRTLGAALAALMLVSLSPAGPQAAPASGIGYTVSLRFLHVDAATPSSGFIVILFDPVWVGRAGGEGAIEGRPLDGGAGMTMNYQFALAGGGDGVRLTGTVHVPGHTAEPVPVEGTLPIGKPGAILRQRFGESEVMLQATVWLDFSLPDLTGRTLRLSQFRGEPVLLDFWATWCGPCRETLPHTQKLHTSGFKVLAVNVGEQREVAARYLQENGYAFPVALDSALEVAYLFTVEAIPAFILIGPDGSVLKKWVGAGHDADIEAALQAARGGQ